MGLDLHLEKMEMTSVYWGNITHNLTDIADAAGIYRVLWRPEESGINTAGDMIPHLEKGLALLKSEPDRFRKYDAPNGWGTYPDFVKFVEGVLNACYENRDAFVRASR